METKTSDDKFESRFRDFDRQFSMMYDSHPDEIRDVIDTIILAATYDNSLVDASFKWDARPLSMIWRVQ